jgi:hypothetical protein
MNNRVLGTIGRNLFGALDLCTSALEGVAKSVHIRHRFQSVGMVLKSEE